MKFPRNARIFRGQLDASPFVGVLFLVVVFLLLNSSLVFIPGVSIRLPEISDLPGVSGPTLTVAVDANRRFYFRNQLIKKSELEAELHKAVVQTIDPLTLVLMADKSVPEETLFELWDLARRAGVKDALLASRPTAPSGRTNTVR